MAYQWCEYCKSSEVGHPTRHCPTSYQVYTDTMASMKAWLESQKKPVPVVEPWPEWLVATGDGYVQKATKKLIE